MMSFLPVLIFIVVIVSIVRTAAKVARKVDQQTPPALPRSAADYDPDLAERTRRIQDEIRRKIAERRGTVVATEPRPVELQRQPPVFFAPESDDSGAEAATNAALVRQQHLAGQMRALELTRAIDQRHAVQVSEGLKTEAASQTGLLAKARIELLSDLRDPASLRRAFVLREVLGTPVGLR